MNHLLQQELQELKDKLEENPGPSFEEFSCHKKFEENSTVENDEDLSNERQFYESLAKNYTLEEIVFHLHEKGTSIMYKKDDIFDLICVFPRDRLSELKNAVELNMVILAYETTCIKVRSPRSARNRQFLC
uniref:Uncharacterized protein n=1 Tax=Acrobeloides nanus TaxID=290746 RepID=A0A914CHH5_9BILA